MYSVYVRYNRSQLNATGTRGDVRCVHGNVTLPEAFAACKACQYECWIVRIDDNATVYHLPTNVL